MTTFEFTLTLSAEQIRSLYRGCARAILAQSNEGIRLQLPAANFRRFVANDGIHGRFRVTIDAGNRIRALTRL